VLKREVFKLAKRRPFLIMANLFVKLVVVSLFLHLRGQRGLHAAKVAHEPTWLDLAFGWPSRSMACMEF